MLLIFIYLIGYIIAYILIKCVRNKYDDGWGDVLGTMILSLLSWLIIVIYILCAVLDKIKFPEKPPKWL